jgi:hypothetical protein
MIKQTLVYSFWFIIFLILSENRSLFPLFLIKLFSLFLFANLKYFSYFSFFILFFGFNYFQYFCLQSSLSAQTSVMHPQGLQHDPIVGSHHDPILTTTIDATYNPRDIHFGYLVWSCTPVLNEFLTEAKQISDVSDMITSDDTQCYPYISQDFRDILVFQFKLSNIYWYAVYIDFWMMVHVHTY